MMQRFGRGGGTRQGGSSRASNVGAGTILSVFSALILPLWILAGGAWIVQVVGLGLCQHQQTNGSHFLQFDWFVSALEVVVLLLVPISLITRRASLGLVALLAVVTVLEILRTNVWNDARLSLGNVNGASGVQIDSVINPGLNASRKRVDTVFAGFLITSAMNLLLLLGLGALPAPSAQDARQLEHGARDAADQHKGGAYNGSTVNSQPGVANNGVAHHGTGHGGIGGPMHNGADRV